jgi:type II secretory pathway pseudopilin PulG
MKQITVRMTGVEAKGRMITFAQNDTGWSAGFTLFEVVIAFMILTLVLLGIGQGLYISQNAWERGEAETGETQRLRILSTMLSQQLKSAHAYKIKIDNEGVVLFEGEEESILFATALADHTYGGFKWVKYSFKDGTLYYNEGRLPDKEVMDHVDDDEELLEADIEAVKFEYYFAEDEEWRDSWDMDESMPNAVRITVSPFEPFLVTIAKASLVKRIEDG